MRYFIIFYLAIDNNNGNAINGYLVLKANKYPSSKFLHEEIKKDSNSENYTITNIFEFKNEQDFNDFNSE